MCEPPRTMEWVEVCCVLIHLSPARLRPIILLLEACTIFPPEYLRILDMHYSHWTT